MKNKIFAFHRNQFTVKSSDKMIQWLENRFKGRKRKTWFCFKLSKELSIFYEFFIKSCENNKIFFQTKKGAFVMMTYPIFSVL